MDVPDPADHRALDRDAGRHRVLVVALWLVAWACGGSEPEAPAVVVTADPAPAVPSSPAPTPSTEPTPDAASTSGDELVIDPDSTTGEPEPEPDPLHGQVRSGDSLSRILNRAGLNGVEIQRVAEALQPVMDPATIRIGQRFEIELDEGGELLSFAFHLSVTEVARVRRADDDSLVGKLEQLPTELREEEIGGTVRSSLWAALSERGHSPALVDVIVDVFAYDIDFFSATRQGDRFRLVVERHELDGELVRYGRVLAAEYEGETSGSVLVLWWEPEGGEGRYVDGEGLGVARTMLKSPLKYARISSGFDPKRMHPVLHRIKSHQGVDYSAPEGTPVWAAADGKIVFRAEKGGAGNLVVLKHDGGLKTLYMHLSRFASDQAVGDAVKAKTVIGYVGQTGLATGPHLHFGMQKRGRYVDPSTIESVRGPGVRAGDRARFGRFRSKWQERLAEVDAGSEPAPPSDDGPDGPDGPDSPDSPDSPDDGAP